MSTRSTAESDDRSREELLDQVDRLTDENRELRDAVLAAKRTQYRRTALGLAALGAAAVAGGALFPAARDVLFALGGIGLFGAVLTYWLSPERFVAADVGRDVYVALAGNERALVDELGLSDRRLYVPVGGGVRLFVPQREDADVPATGDLDRTLVAPDETTRGVALDPSGQPLFDAFEDALTGSLGTTPETLATQLTDALVEQFELVDAATPDVDADDGRLTVSVSGSVYGPVDRLDHPVASLLAVGVATGLDQPVALEVTDDGDSALVTCTW